MKISNLMSLPSLLLLVLFAPTFVPAQDFYSCMNDFLIKDTPKISGVKGAVSKPSRKWLPGQQIRVKFLDGNQFVQSKVMENAKLWEDFANVDFDFVRSGAAEIRISFNTDKGSWSFIGKDSVRQSWIKKAMSPSTRRTIRAHR